MKAANRNRLTLVLVVVAMVAIGLFQYHTQAMQEQRVVERDSRCAKQAAAPYVPFKGDASCIGWQRKSGSPMPIEG